VAKRNKKHTAERFNILFVVWLLMILTSISTNSLSKTWFCFLTQDSKRHYTPNFRNEMVYRFTVLKPV
jgi:hypothetical protein